MSENNKNTILKGLHTSSLAFIGEQENMRTCLQIFQNKKCGAVLVLGGKTRNAHEELVGIITERDILLKFFKLIEPNELEEPVRKYMTPHPITLPVGSIREAAEVMIKNNFRHIIFTVDDTEKNKTVAGILSMRDIFKEYIEGNTRVLSPYMNIQCQALLVSSSNDTRRIFRALFEKIKKSTLKIVDFKEKNLLEDLKNYTHIFFDLDQESAEVWSGFILNTLTIKPQLSKLTIIFNPQGLNQKTLKILMKISDSGQFKLLEKPLDLSVIFKKLSEKE